MHSAGVQAMRVTVPNDPAHGEIEVVHMSIVAYDVGLISGHFVACVGVKVV
jgi:hypothetical protein